MRASASRQNFRQVLAHIRLTGRLADVIYSMETTNTEFHAHQFKPVIKMLASPTGSLLIADEVGLGKTIEAGLIWTELRARFDYRRLLVICPKVLCTKWEAELTGKFGLHAHVYSAAELLTVLRDRDRWARGFVAVCSLQGLKPPRGWDDEADAQYGRPVAELSRLLRDRAEDEPLFDMLVIDEARHPPESRDPEFACSVVFYDQRRSTRPFSRRPRSISGILTSSRSCRSLTPRPTATRRHFGMSSRQTAP